MCRNIRPLFNFQPPATDEEIRDAALQFVRKISGFQRPSQANAELFEATVAAVTDAARALVLGLETSAPPKNRLVEAERRRAKNAARFG